MVYATDEQLASYLHGQGSSAASLPADADRLLVRASELVDEYIVTAVYTVDADNNPTDQKIITALADATCAQVEYWLAGDEEDDILGPVQGMSLAGLQVQYGAGDNRATPMYLAPRAYRALNRAGLVRSAVWS